MPSKNLLFFSCNEISFEPGSIPQYIKQSGINFLSTRSDTIKRIQEAIWFGSVPQNVKLAYANEISKDIHVLSFGESLGNLFVLSLFHRCFSILTSSAKLYIDNSNIKPVYKYAATFMLSALPSLFLIFIVGYPPTDLLLNALTIQASSAVLSYCSLKVGNYIRSLDLISDTKEVNKFAYLGRVLVSTAIDIALTLAWRGQELYKDPMKMSDTYHILQYCMEKDESNKVSQSISIIYPANPLISITDKLIWLTGRLAVDAMVYGAYSLGKIKDIRSPFIDAFTRKQNEPLRLEEYRRASERRSRTPRTNYRSNEPEVFKGQAPRSSISQQEERKESVPMRTELKKKTRKNIDSITTDTTDNKLQQQDKSHVTGEITINGLTFYQIHGTRIPANTWGVLSLRKSSKELHAYETALSTGHVHNRRAAVKYMGNIKKYSIRPKSQGDRILGKLQAGSKAFKDLFLLGEAMDTYETLRQVGGNKEPNLIIFNERVKHDAISKGK